MEKFCAKITAIGSEALGLLKGNMIIIFNNNAPEGLAEYTIMHSIEELKKEVEKDDVVTLGGHDYEVLYVGSKANHTLRELGHCTFYFETDEKKCDVLPGYIVLKGDEKPQFEIGQTIAINLK